MGAERRSAAVAVTSVCVALGGSVREFVRFKVAGSSNGQVSCFPYTVSTLSLSLCDPHFFLVGAVSVLTHGVP